MLFRSASWMFVIWGALHGIAIVLHRAWQQMGQKMNTLLAWFVTFNFINITWIFFRAENWQQAKNILSGMLGGALVLPLGSFLERYDLPAFISFSDSWLANIYADKYMLWYLFFAMGMSLFFRNSGEWLQQMKPNGVFLIAFILMFVISFSHLSGVHEFLYFNF